MTSAERFRQLACTRAVRANLPSRSIRAATFTAGAGFIDFAVRIGSTAWLARLIIPEHFGLVMMATAVTAIADQLRDLGLSSATVQKPDITHEEVTNLFWINVAVGVALAGLLCLLSPVIAAYYHEPRLVAVACILSTTLLCGSLTVQHQALLTRQLRLGQTSAIRLGSSVGSTALAIGLALGGWGYWALLWREVARAGLLALGMWLSFRWVPGLPYWQTNVRGLLKFGANLTAANVIGTLAAGADRFLLGRFGGAEPVAMYRQAYQLITAPTDQLLSPLYQVTQPGLSLLQQEPDRYRRFYAKVVSLVGIITMPLSLFVALYAREITALLLGPRWTDAAPLLAVLSLGTFIKQAVGSAAQIPITRGRGGIYLGLSLLQNTTLIVLMMIGVRWGALGVAVAEVISLYLLIAPKLHYCLKDSPVSKSTFLKALIRPAVASGIMLAALALLKPQFPPATPVLTLAVGATLGALVFSALWLLLPGGRSELASLMTDVRSAFRRRAAPASVATAESAPVASS